MDGLAAPGEDGRIDLPKFGYKSPPIPPRRPPEVFRVLFIGGSSVYSITKPAFSFPVRFAEHLRELFPTKSIEVVNLGVPGAGFVEYIALYRFWRDRLDHDAVVYAVHPGSDWQDHRYSQALAIFGPQVVARDDILISPNGVYAAIRAASAGSDATLSERLASPMPPDARYDAWSQFTDAAYLAILRDWTAPYRVESIGSLCSGYDWARRFMAFVGERASGDPIPIVLLSPAHTAVSQKWRDRLLAAEGLEPTALDTSIPGTVLARFAERAGGNTPVLDLTPALQQMTGDRADIFFGTNSHWSVEGNYTVGRLAASLAAHHLFRTDARPNDKHIATAVSGAAVERWQTLADALWDGRSDICN